MIHSSLSASNVALIPAPTIKALGVNLPAVIKVAMSDPLDIRAMDDISIITGLQIERYVATPGDIAAAIDRSEERRVGKECRL